MLEISSNPARAAERSEAEPGGASSMDRRHFIGHVSVAAAGGSVLTAAKTLEEKRCVTYAIKGFTCVTCAVGLKVMLRLQDGVTRANASYPAALTPPLCTEAYVYHRGGILRFSKLTMNDADLDIVGDRPREFSSSRRSTKSNPLPAIRTTPRQMVWLHAWLITLTSNRTRQLTETAQKPR